MYNYSLNDCEAVLADTRLVQRIDSILSTLRWGSRLKLSISCRVGDHDMASQPLIDVGFSLLATSFLYDSSLANYLDE